MYFFLMIPALLGLVACQSAGEQAADTPNAGGGAGGGDIECLVCDGCMCGQNDPQSFKTDPAVAALPPGPAEGPPPDGTGASIQAFTRVFLGDTDRTGATRQDA
jgi:hypothetical protein